MLPKACIRPNMSNASRRRPACQRSNAAAKKSESSTVGQWPKKPNRISSIMVRTPFPEKHRQLVMRALTDLRHAGQRVAGLVLDAPQGGDPVRHLDDQVDAHVALGLHEQGQFRGLADGLVVFDHGLVAGLLGWQRK